MKSHSLLAFATLLTLAGISSVFADEQEPPLYVAETGADSGNCSAKSPCASIGFALQRAGKNGRILIGAGAYPVDDVADLVYLMSGAVDVRSNALDGKTTTLVGVPPEFASDLQSMGFRVIADSKGMRSPIVAAQLSLQSSTAATECINGIAGSFECQNLDLLARVADRAATARGADIWGFIDLNTNREYAIVGYATGTAVYDVTNPEQPREIGFIDGQQTTWRDIKVHQAWNETQQRWNAYAYITADSSTDGLFIIDLTDLPHSISRLSYNSDFSSAHNVYLVDADFSTGLSVTGDAPLLVLAGSNISDGRFRTYSLADPRAPAFIAAPSTPVGQPGGDRLYMHDAASMIVTDSRKDSQCINAAGSDHCDVLFDFNESSIDIWDVTDPSNPSILSQLPYSNTGYTHSGWPSEDQQFVFVQDELDERDRGLVTTLRVISIADLRAPTISTTWTGPTSAIDHNGFVRGNRYYMSNYARGFTVLDITNPQSATEVGRFDTYPASDNVGFPGNWGAYPYLPSGHIALSDIDSGLYLLADNTLASTAGTLSFTAQSFAASESESLTLTVQRSGGSAGATSVRWEVVPATAGADDIATMSGQLTWQDGDSGDKTISIDALSDGVAENLEQFLVRLVAPTGGATVAAPFISHAFISDAGAAASLTFSADTISVAERGFGTAVATLHRNGSADGSVSVDFSITGGDAAAGDDYDGPDSGTVNWADGDATPKNLEFMLSDDATSEGTEFFELTLSNPQGATLGAASVIRVEISDAGGSNSAPNAMAGGSQSVSAGANVTLDGNASNDPDGDNLSYAWTQTDGQSVSLSNASSSQASFVAPNVNSDTLLRFQLEVTDTSGASDTSTTNVTVNAQAGSSSGGGGGGGSTGLVLVLGLLALGISRRRGAT